MIRRLLATSFSALALTIVPMTATAQPREGRFVDASLGLGLSAPYDESDVDGQGVIAKAEYVLGLYSFVGLRAYGGLLLTWPDQTDRRCSDADIDCEVTAKIGFVGGKGRLAAPIPWVAPFIEVGLGLSLGTLRTRTPESDSSIDGAALHIPFTLGLALGPDHDVEVAFAYYFHPSANQFNGGLTIGLSFPIGNEEAPAAAPQRAACGLTSSFFEFNSKLGGLLRATRSSEILAMHDDAYPVALLEQEHIQRRRQTRVLQRAMSVVGTRPRWSRRFFDSDSVTPVLVRFSETSPHLIKRSQSIKELLHTMHLFVG